MPTLACKIHRCPPFSVFHSSIRPTFEQQLHQVGAADVRGLVQRRHAVLLDRIHVGTRLDEHARDGPERMSVLIRITDSHDAAVGELDATGSLDLQEERFDGVGDPRDRLARERRLAGVDVRAATTTRPSPVRVRDTLGDGTDPGSGKITVGSRTGGSSSLAGG